ncbi:MAG: FecR domain-containing protein [Planctomycetota bacterium]
MDCEHALELISARWDRELEPEQEKSLDAHLASCDSCREELDAVREQHESLLRSFGTLRRDADRVAEQAIAEIRDTGMSVAGTPRTSSSSWTMLILSAAAGFLIAVGVFRPWDSAAPVQGPALPAVVAHMGLASGVVEALPKESTTWSSLRTGDAIPAGTRIRTSQGARCEISSRDGSSFRLDRNTELLLTDSRDLQLQRGHVWSSVAKRDDPFRIGVPSAELDVVALGTRFAIALTEASAQVSVVEGSARLESQHWEADAKSLVKGGELARVEKNQIVEKRQIKNVIQATSWMNEILVLKGENDPELRTRVNKLLAIIGRSKTTLLLETEIRSLGESCVAPLIAFTQSELSRGPQAFKQRHDAARLASELASSRFVPQFIELLQDDDAMVRWYAARALERTTGRRTKFDANLWRRLKRRDLKDAFNDWVHWFRTNQGLYPEGDWAFDWRPEPNLKKKASNVPGKKKAKAGL